MKKNMSLTKVAMPERDPKAVSYTHLLLSKRMAVFVWYLPNTFKNGLIKVNVRNKI